MITNIVARELSEPPIAHRGLGRCLRETGKSYLFEYYGHELFIPKRVIVKAQGSYWAPAWAVENAKKFNEERRQ
jgi:hypothetical protein